MRQKKKSGGQINYTKIDIMAKKFNNDSNYFDQSDDEDDSCSASKRIRFSDVTSESNNTKSSNSSSQSNAKGRLIDPGQPAFNPFLSSDDGMNPFGPVKISKQNLHQSSFQYLIENQPNLYGPSGITQNQKIN